MAVSCQRSESAEPELFWALRGGGGNFGVVTEFEFELHPLPAGWGGIITYARPHLGDAIRLFCDVMASAPDELTLMCYLDHEKFPEDAASITVCFVGAAADAEDGVRPLRETLPVLSDGLGITSYLQIQVIQGDLPFGLQHYWKSQFSDALPDTLIDELVDHYLAHPADGAGVLLFEQLHGAAVRVSPDATAFSRRTKCFNVSALATWEDAAHDAERIAWARQGAVVLEKHSASGGGYMNYGAPDEPADRVRAADGEANFGRLQQVKRRYDPPEPLPLQHNFTPTAT